MRTPLSVLIAVLLLNTSVWAQTVPLVDSRFSDLDWRTIVLASSEQGGARASQSFDAEGDAVYFLLVTQAVGGSSVVRSIHLGQRMVLYPAESGGIRSLSFSVRARVISTEPGTFGGGIGPVVRQNDRLYAASLVPVRADPGGPLPSPYETHAFNDLPPESFHLLTGAQEVDTSQHPDFSARGDPLELGFYIVNSHTGGSPTERIVGVFSLTITPSVQVSEPPPRIIAHPISQTAKVGGTVLFQVISLPPTVLKFQWYKDGVPIPEKNETFLELRNIALSDAGDYTVLVANPGGTVLSAAASLRVEDPAPPVVPPAILTQPSGLAVTEGSSLLISVVASGDPPLTYRWKKDGVVIPGAAERSLVWNGIRLSDAGDYSVVVSNGEGSVESRSAQIVVFPLVTPPFRVEAHLVAEAQQRTLKLDWTGGIGPFTVQEAATPMGPWTVAARTIFAQAEIADISSRSAAFYKVSDEFVPGPGQGALRQTSPVLANFTEGAVFDRNPIPPREPNRNPRPPLRLKIGPLRGPLTPTVGATGVKAADLGAGAALATVSDPVRFARRTDLGRQGSTNYVNHIPVDSSGAAAGLVSFLTGNTWAAFSADGGVRFRFLDITNIFPSGPITDHNGLCCDQVVNYVPSIDRFIWVMQFWPVPTNSTVPQRNMLRIASASPQDIVQSNGTAWTYWDLFSQRTFGFPGWFDYPDIAIGSNNLFLSIDHRGVADAGRVVMRMSLADIASSSRLSIDYTDPSLSVHALFGHLTQNTGDQVFWAGHFMTSQMRIWSLADGQNLYYWRDVAVQSWNAYATNQSTTPSGGRWMAHASPGAGVIGAVRSGNDLWFAWTAGAGAGFAHPQIQMVRFDATTFAAVEQVQIWNPDHAYAYPALAVNSLGELGLAVGYGGGPFEAGGAVGIWGDFTVWHPGLSTFSWDRFGDFFGVTRHHPDGRLFSAAVYNDVDLGGGRQFNPIYILFGRRSVVP